MSATAAVRLPLPEGRTLRLALRFIHFAAMLLALVVCGPSLTGAVITGAISVHLYLLEMRRRALAEALLAVLFDSTGVWYLQWRDGTRERARLAPGAVVSPWLTILALDGSHGRFALFVTPDMLPPDSFRRLRMRLLWQRPAVDADARTARSHVQ